MDCSGPHMLGTEFMCHIIEESIRVWCAHAKGPATLLKARLSPTARWHGFCGSYASTSRRRGRGSHGSSWANYNCLVGGRQVSLFLLSTPF